jgi:hypothetical protein
MKILNHSNGHYTGLVIEKNQDNQNYSISHINSTGCAFKSSDFKDEKAIKEFIIKLIEDGDPTHEQLIDGHRITITEQNPEKKFYSTFFSDRAFKIDSNKIDKLIDKTTEDFKPFGQAQNTCHQMAVMNMFKYYLEKSST